MAKMQKKEMVKGFERLLEAGYPLTKESSHVLKYTIDMFNDDARNVTIQECADIIQDLKEETGLSLSELLATLDGQQIVEPQKVVEAKVVKPVKLPEKKVENSEKKTEPEKKAETEKKPIKAKKEQKPEKLTINQQDSLESFPEEIYSETLKATLKLRNDIENIEQLAEAFNVRQEDLVLTTFWTKKLLKQYASGYDPFNVNPSRPTEFPDNLDVIELTHVSNLVATGISIYSNVPQIILPNDLLIHEGNIRYANGCELQIYEVIEDEPSKE